MIQNKHIGKIMIKSANSANLPLLVGFSVVRYDGCLKLKTKDVRFTPDVVKDILSDAKNVKCVGVMHSNIDVISQALSVIENVWNGDLIAYPDCGTFKNNIWTTDATEIEMEKIAQTLLKCKEKHPNLQIVGGCCGLGLSFIKKLKKIFTPYLDCSDSITKKFIS